MCTSLCRFVHFPAYLPSFCLHDCLLGLYRSAFGTFYLYLQQALRTHLEHTRPPKTSNLTHTNTSHDARHRPRRSPRRTQSKVSPSQQCLTLIPPTDQQQRVSSASSVTQSAKSSTRPSNPQSATSQAPSANPPAKPPNASRKPPRTRTSGKARRAM